MFSSKKFPSPCGDIVLKYVRILCFNELWIVFPSPCGDMVLKLLENEVLGRYKNGFRPLAGIWF